MKYDRERAIARDLLFRGLATVTDVAGAAGVYRQTAVQWAVKLDVATARRNHLSASWLTLSMMRDTTSDQDRAVAIMRAGLALPIELAPLVGRDAQTLRLWAREAQIDAKAARRAACAALWRSEIDKRVSDQAEYDRRWAEFNAGGHNMALCAEGPPLYRAEFNALPEAERTRLTTYLPRRKGK
jgi:hypothetical protein